MTGMLPPSRGRRAKPPLRRPIRLGGEQGIVTELLPRSRRHRAAHPRQPGGPLFRAFMRWFQKDGMRL